MGTQLREAEAVCGAHAPHFPCGGPKEFPEAWWLILSQGSKIISIERVIDPRRDVEAHMKFRVMRAGKHHYTLKVRCEVYHGLDFEVDVKFTAIESPSPEAQQDDCNDEDGEEEEGENEDYDDDEE